MRSILAFYKYPYGADCPRCIHRLVVMVTVFLEVLIFAFYNFFIQSFFSIIERQPQ